MGPRNGIRVLGGALLALLFAAPAAAQTSFVPELGSPFPTGPESFGVVARDFNGDERPDVAVVSSGDTDGVAVYLRQPAGGFAQESGSPFAVGDGPNFAASADFNGDARPDLAVSNFFTSNVSVLLRQSSGGFAEEDTSPVAVTGGASAVAAADFNADGLPDLAIAEWNSAAVAVALRQPGGSFSVQQRAQVGTNPRQLAVADFNGDQVPDLAVANWSDGDVTVLLGNGTGGFSSEATFEVGGQPEGLGAADFNGDGRTDLAVSASVTDSVTLLARNAANDGFDVGSPVRVPAGARGLTIADFDGDGRPDVAVASETDGTVSILGGGTAAEPAIALGGGQYGVDTADFDADSRPDLAVSSATGGTFTSLLNTTQPPLPPLPPLPPPTPPPAPTPSTTQLPPPVAGETINALPKSGRVRIKVPGSNRYVDLTEGRQIPIGTRVDTRQGRVTLVAAGEGGTADFFSGLFRISQTRGARPLTTLTLTEPLACPRARRSATSAARKKTRRLWGDGRGRFRTRGNYAAATVRGTRWLTQDRCNSTRVRVRAGSVNVRDNVRRRTVIVRAGRSYTARRRS